MQDHGQTVLLAVTRDITERKQAQTALRTSEERYRTLVDWMPNAITVHRDGKIVYVNQAAVTLFGAQSKQDFLGQPFLDRVHPDFHQFTLARMRMVTEHTVAVPMLEAKYLKQDGTVIDVEVQSTPIVYDGKPAIHTVARDITERRLAEQYQRIAAIAFESQEGIFITDAAKVIVRVNQAFTDITGYTAVEAVGQTPSLLNSGRHDAAFFAAMMEGIQRNGTWQGEIWNRRKNGEVHPEWLMVSAVKDDDGEITNYVATLTDITQRKRAEAEINQLAFYDQLTGLPNRRLLTDRLRQALATRARHQRHGALLFIDLDNFKALNDTLGHDMGDILLHQVAQRLVTGVRACDTVARLGGDEFVVMLDDLSENAQDAAAQTETVGEKILAALNQTYLISAREHHSTASIGITLFREHTESVDELMKRADTAMYQAKAAGRNTLRFFDHDMQVAVTTRAALEVDLRRAIKEQQFLIYYQAQLDSRGRVLGAEALLRWPHPERGLVSPAEFIPLAEDTGLILPLGQWVLKTACERLALWAARPELADLSLAVNVSARQFHHRDFVEQVLAALARSGANPQRLKLELTESLLVHDMDDIIVKMTVLKEKGVGFSLDDFGTGYSSLSYLKRLPLDQLKIDQSFVRDILTDPDDAAIARMIIVLGESLGLTVIAEGVESEAQRDFLATQGCQVYQGYLFSRPLPVKGFEEFVLQG
ncbi:MAG: EAL domain-containing protein [Propionivibrio sp.]|nr:EAL domain-containing protein [Propionivibrio sp.]